MQGYSLGSKFSNSPCSESFYQNALEQRLESIQLPAIERRRLQIIRRGDAFSKTFKEALMGPESKPFHLSFSSQNFIDARKVQEYKSIRTQTEKIEKQISSLKKSSNFIYDNKKDLRGSLYLLKDKITSKILEIDRPEFRHLKNGLIAQNESFEIENVELKEEIRQLAEQIISLKERVAKATAKTNLLVSFLSEA